LREIKAWQSETPNLSAPQPVILVSAKENEKFPAACKVGNDLLKQGYGAERAKSSTL
jgi:hypothetical protein